MPKARKTDRCYPEYDEHQNYQLTGNTWTETLPGGHKIVWKVRKCQCGARKSLTKK